MTVTFCAGNQVSLRKSYYGAGSGPVQFGGVQCLGNESTLLNCFYNSSVKCSATHHAGVMCPGEVMLSLYHNYLDACLLHVCCDNCVILFQSGPPFKYEHPQNVTVTQNDNATFNCSATGIKAPTIKWYKQFQNGTLHLISETGSHFISSIASGDQKLTSQLSISNVVFSDTGSYVCKAISIGISSTSSAFLTIFGRKC